MWLLSRPSKILGLGPSPNLEQAKLASTALLRALQIKDLFDLRKLLCWSLRPFLSASRSLKAITSDITL